MLCSLFKTQRKSVKAAGFKRIELCVALLVLLKIDIYGYLNRIQSSRRLERETQRNTTW